MFIQQTINVVDVLLSTRKHLPRSPCTFCDMEDTICLNSFRLEGFVIKQTAPLSIESSISLEREEVVYIITGMCCKCGSFFISTRHSLPCMRGILRSKKIMSGRLSCLERRISS